MYNNFLQFLTEMLDYVLCIDHKKSKRCSRHCKTLYFIVNNSSIVIIYLQNIFIYVDLALKYLLCLQGCCCSIRLLTKQIVKTAENKIP